MWSARPFNSDMPDPFGRNPKKTEDEQLSAGSVKCPSCASNIFYQPEVQGLVCRNCGNIYSASTLEKIGSLGYTIEHDYMSDVDISGDDKKRHEIVCDSCGAAMIADENMMSTVCPFCGSPAIISRRMMREFKPDYIIPFKIDKNTAEINMKKWINTRKYTPRGFKSKSKLIKMTALYVPFWLLDCKVNSDIYGTGRIGLGEAFKVYEVKATTSYYVKGVPFDASLKIANKLMEAIEPFDYSEMVKFEKKYLQGFCADKYDQRPTEIMERFVKRLDRFSQENYKNISGKYDTFEPRTQKNFTWMSDVNIKYCLMPVWFMTVEFDGRQYQFAVNGQTGEASGQAPTTSATDKLDSFARFARSNWKWLPVALAIVLPGFIYNSVSVSDYSPFYVFLVVALVVLEIALIAFSIALFVAGHVAGGVSKTIHKTADPANDFDKDPGLDRYLDTTRKVTFNSDEEYFRREGREYPDDDEEIMTVGDLLSKRRGRLL